MAKKYFIYGFQSVRETIAYRSKDVHRLYLQQQRSDERIQELVGLAQAAHIPMTWASRSELDRILGDVRHQGIAIQCNQMAPLSESMLKKLLSERSKSILLLILDGVQDPHNLGACIRTANAMGVDAVIAPKDRAVGLTEIVHKTACGATAVTPFIQVTNLARTLRELKEHGVWLLGLDVAAKTSLVDINIGPRAGLIMGSEDQGLRRLTKEECDYLAHIPMRGSVASLNVSVAAAIGLYEIRRQF